MAKNRSFCKACRIVEQNNLDNQSEWHFLRRMLNVARSRANTKQIPCTITIEELWNQYQSQNCKCYYTNLEMQWGYGKGRSPFSMSLDQVIPGKGYIPGNVVVCCDAINRAKSDHSSEDIKIIFSTQWWKKL